MEALAAEVAKVALVSPAQRRDAHEALRATEARALAMRAQLRRLLGRIAAHEGAAAMRGLARGGVLKQERADPRRHTLGDDFDLELLRLFEAFGLRQLRDGAVMGAAQGGLSLGTAWDLRPGVRDRFIADKQIKVVEMRAETKRIVDETVRRITRDADAETPRPSLGDVARRLQLQLPQTGAYTPARAERIARTEVGTAIESGRREGFLVAGVRHHKWVSLQIPGRTRGSHFRAHGQVQPINRPYRFRGENGGEVVLWHPKDASGPPEEVINCMCADSPVRNP